MYRTPFEIGEWYHCYSRGVDKRRTFHSSTEYERFLQALYLCNSDNIVERSHMRMSHHEILHRQRGDPIVALGAYCLMPNHFHLLLKETTEGGIARFMQRVGTSYSMYFNIRHERVGNVFVRPFRSRHVRYDEYFQHVVGYIHLNSAELFQFSWKENGVSDIRKMSKSISEYPYSSLPSYIKEKSINKKLLDSEAFEFISSTMKSLEEVVEDASSYRKDLISNWK